MILAFLGVNLFLRLLLLPLNSAAYTDGVLQVTQATDPTALWPPLYGWLTACFSWAMPTLYAGRLVSTLAGALGLLPLWILARRAGGRRAAFFAALLYTLAPVSLRWSARMMGDALFATLFWAALERWDAAERFIGQSREENPKGTGHAPHDGRLAIAVLFTAAATLARYQGVLLLPLLGITWLRAAWGFFNCRRNNTYKSYTTYNENDPQSSEPAPPPLPFSFPWKTLAASVTLLAVPVWVQLQGIAHGQQFSERLGTTLSSALQVISLNGEAFFVLTPYFLTYPVALWVVFGLVRGGGRGTRTLLAATLYVGFAVIVLQSAFSSFQERYMLPWYGLLWAWGGIGLALVQDLLQRRARAFSVALGATVLWSAFVALSVLLLQHRAFGDFSAAGQWLRQNAPADAPIYSSEVYNPDLGGRLIATNKIRFFSDRDVKFFPPPSMAGGIPDLPPGSLVCLHSTYPFWTEEMFVRAYVGRRLFEADVEILPLFPDIMEQPGTAQNPTAWFYRYQPQHFWTTIWVVDRKREP